MDEVYLSFSLVRMNYIDLATKTLDYQQKAPILFLWAAKFSVNLLGNKEMALRIIPLISGIISIFLFIPVCKYFLKPVGQIIALSILCFAPALIYHSVEIKQYSTECMSTIASIYLFIIFNDSKIWQKKILWGISGAILLWLSYSAIFVMVGIASAVTINYIAKKEWKQVLINLPAFLIWMISFILNYILFTHKHAESNWIVYWFKSYNNFMPFPPRSINDLKWYPINLSHMMDYPLGLIWDLKNSTGSQVIKIIKAPILPVTLLIVSVFSLIKKNKLSLLVLTFPILVTCASSSLNLYPLTERFWVFIAPIFILLIAIGFEYFEFNLKSKYLKWVLLLLVVSCPLIQSIGYLVHPEKLIKHKISSQRESLSFIIKQFHKKDIVYVYWNDLPGYRFYNHFYAFNLPTVEGRDFRKISKNLEDYNQKLHLDFNKFSTKKRVWLIYNTQFSTNIGDNIDEPKWYYNVPGKSALNLLSEFYKLGKPLKKYVTSDITVYLFELRTTSRNN